MSEVAHREPGLCLVPASHGVFTAHRLPRVVESASGIEGGAPLGGHDERDRGQRADASAVPACLIERREHEAAQILAPLAHAPENLQIVFVEGFLGSVVARFVSAEPEDEEVDAALLELSPDVRLVVVE
jgi:hypothetical protein